MMHGSEWTLKYDEPEVESVTRRRSPSVTFSTEGHHISMFNVARTTVLHNVLSYGQPLAQNSISSSETVPKRE